MRILPASCEEVIYMGYEEKKRDLTRRGVAFKGFFIAALIWYGTKLKNKNRGLFGTEKDQILNRPNLNGITRPITLKY